MKPSTDLKVLFAELADCLDERDLHQDVPPAHLHDWSDERAGQPLALVTPRSTKQVSDVMAVCARHSIPVVPQGGLSGLAGGAVPSEGCLLLSLARMNAIEELDSAVGTMRVQAGAVLQTIQEQAESEGWMFALDLGARGSCQIGGNIATNAGGNRVIRYGVMRDLVLGLEVVLADGQVLDLMQSMKKNNTGLDLRQLFIGSEGTLGIITRAVLKLSPGVGGANTALIAFANYDQGLQFLKQAQTAFSGHVSAFELMWPDYYQFALKTLGRPDQFDRDYGYYLLFDVQSSHPEQDYPKFEQLMADAFENGTVENAVLASSERETEELWQLRDCVSEILSINAPTINFDVSVSLNRIGDFADQLKATLDERFPNLITLFFGHVGDGNLHLVAGPVQGGKEMEHAIESEVYRITRDFSGSVSAEHGIGLHKKKWLSHSRSESELALMKSVKQAVDPQGLLNPGKIMD
ncbi:FAD-binding oxidoreductase [Marinobacter daepoensis]|uniref:FAD-binding oxidoreductase n=1 Tax=Marinobacter daepoensis TaxID=262077 RepID=UPI0004117616|nr:FAD-binding oxidoreductase [Marinobacter daepoensis]